MQLDGKTVPNHSGRRCGDLTFLQPFCRTGQGVIWWLRCDCGNTVLKPASVVLQGNTGSCGCWSLRKRGAPGSAGLTELYGEYRRNAKKAGRDFTITPSEFKEVTSQDCYYCGLAPRQIKVVGTGASTEDGVENSKYIYNGVDRIDNAGGYTRENCRPACKDCNMAKGFRDHEQFVQWLERIAEGRAWRKHLQ